VIAAGHRLVAATAVSVALRHVAGPTICIAAAAATIDDWQLRVT
jgi:hypothetical protein